MTVLLSVCYSCNDQNQHHNNNDNNINSKQYRECNKIHLPFSINMMMRDYLHQSTLAHIQLCTFEAKFYSSILCGLILLLIVMALTSGWLLQLLAALETSFVFYSECNLSNLLPWLCIAAIFIWMHICVRVVWWLLELSSQSALKYLRMYYWHWCFPVVFVIFAMVVVVAWKNIEKILIRILSILGLDRISGRSYVSCTSNYQIVFINIFPMTFNEKRVGVRECFDTNNNSHNNRARSKESQMELRRLYKKPSHRDIIHPHFIINCSQLITTTTNVQ
uniref:Uncharacterized protein n=1 Tax=Glossina pallidipes TaxID=7398 RepID=A0A1A9ZTY1_GLOPL